MKKENSLLLKVLLLCAFFAVFFGSFACSLGQPDQEVGKPDPFNSESPHTSAIEIKMLQAKAIHSALEIK